MKSVVELAEGDMRKALNLLQSCSMAFPEVNPETAYMTLGHPTPEDILAILNLLLNDDFSVAFRSEFTNNEFFFNGPFFFLIIC
jgi:replication factor C subunit 3/5